MLLSIQLVSSFVICVTVYVLVQWSVFELVVPEGSSTFMDWIRGHLMCFCLHDEAIPRLSRFTFIDLPVMAMQNLDSICSCRIRRNTNTKSQAKTCIGWKNHWRALKGGFVHCFLQHGVSEESLHLPEILITWFHFYYNLLMFSYKTAYISV